MSAYNCYKCGEFVATMSYLWTNNGPDENSPVWTDICPGAASGPNMKLFHRKCAPAILNFNVTSVLGQNASVYDAMLSPKISKEEHDAVKQQVVDLTNRLIEEGRQYEELLEDYKALRDQLAQIKRIVNEIDGATSQE